jgi:hypothetical protein
MNDVAADDWTTTAAFEELDGAVPDAPSAGPRPRPGDRIGICTAEDAEATSALVETAGDDTWVVRLDARAPTRDAAVFVRCVDDDGQAWGAPADLRPSGTDTARLRVRRRGPWTPVGARGAVRIPAGEPVAGAQELTMRGERVAASRTYRFSILDVSGTGCRAAVVGRAPEVGAAVRLGASGALGISLDARVVRVTPGAFGRTELGMVFLQDRPEQRRAALAWRDALARGAR